MLKIPYHVCIKRCKKSYIFNTTLVTNFKKIRLKCGVRVATLYTVVYRLQSTLFQLYTLKRFKKCMSTVLFNLKG